MKTAKPKATNDEIRGDILTALYQVHQRSRSPKSAAIPMMTLAKTLKNAKGYKAQEVSSNLDYLVQKTWAAAVTTSRSWTSTAGTTQSAEQVTYKISSLGIDKLEGGSLYKAPPIGGVMNITTINGVTVVGEGNVVNARFTEASKALQQLRDAVSSDESLPAAKKLGTLSDLDSIATQLQKPEPNATVVSMLWHGVKNAVVAGHALELLHVAAHHLAPLLR